MPVMAMRNEWHVKKRISISRTLSCPMDMCEYTKSPPVSPIMSGTNTILYYITGDINYIIKVLNYW